MANQNLSQFGEKLFVADADHTFIWDSAVSISKRVSRNSWLNSGTITSDAPVTISQTWGNSGQTFKALVVNAAGTSDANSASGSSLLDLQLGGVSKVSVSKTGTIFFPSGQSIGNSNTAFVCGGGNFYPVGTLAAISTLGTVGVPFAGIWLGTSNQSAFLTSDSLNTLALRNGALAQTFNVYGTYTSGTSYERLTLSAPSAANAIIGTNKGSGGGTARGLEIQTDGVTRMSINSTGAVTFDSNVNINSSLRITFINNQTSALSMFVFASDATGASTYALGGSAPLMRFGGTTDSFPAIARDNAGIKFTGGAAGSTAWVKVPPVAVTALPDATVAGVGARAFVNDALAPTFGSAVTGGGSVPVPVYSTGSAWNVG